MANTKRSRARQLKVGFVALGVALTAIAVATRADDRHPLYEEARRDGIVGEKPDGYLGLVVPPSPELRRVIQDIQIKRKALYVEEAKAHRVTVDEYAFTAGCQAIARTLPGEKYQNPNGIWLTRGTEPPVRDTRCP